MSDKINTIQTKPEKSKFQFNIFYEHYEKTYGKPYPTILWLTWFIGFCEGEGNHKTVIKKR